MLPPFLDCGAVTKEEIRFSDHIICFTTIGCSYGFAPTVGLDRIGASRDINSVGWLSSESAFDSESRAFVRGPLRIGRTTNVDWRNYSGINLHLLETPKVKIPNQILFVVGVG